MLQFCKRKTAKVYSFGPKSLPVILLQWWHLESGFSGRIKNENRDILSSMLVVVCMLRKLQATVL
jgi:hypothetical protein